jgi:hypothetical protein
MTVVIPTIPEIPDPPAKLSATLLAGAKLTSMPSVSGGVITALDHVQSMMGQLGPGLAAAQPIFALVNAVTATFDLIQAVITADPPGIIEAVQKAAEALSTLTSMIPQVAVPRMVIDVLTIVVAALQAVEQTLSDILESRDAALAVIAEAQAAGNAALEAAGNDMLAQADQMAAHACASLGPLGDLIGVVQNLLSLVPGLGPAIPVLPDCSSLSTTEKITSIQESIGAFQSHPLFEAIPPEAPIRIAAGPVETKAGILLPGDFSGSPLRASVVFGQPYPGGLRYAITLSPLATGDNSFATAVESRIDGGFSVLLCTSVTTGLTEIGWQAIPRQN